jgi:hypothetical protein
MTYGKIRRALEHASVEEQPLAEALAAEALTKEDIGNARKLGWKRKVETGMRPGMPRAERRASARKAAVNLPRIATALHALREVAEIATVPPLMNRRASSRRCFSPGTCRRTRTTCTAYTPTCSVHRRPPSITNRA